MKELMVEPDQLRDNLIAVGKQLLCEYPEERDFILQTIIKKLCENGGYSSPEALRILKEGFNITPKEYVELGKPTDMRIVEIAKGLKEDCGMTAKGIAKVLTFSEKGGGVFTCLAMLHTGASPEEVVKWAKFYSPQTSNDDLKMVLYHTWGLSGQKADSILENLDSAVENAEMENELEGEEILSRIKDVL